MFHLVYSSYSCPVLLKSSLLVKTLEDFVNQLPVPTGGLIFGVYNEYGRFYGWLGRCHSSSSVTFIKSRLYETKNPGIIHFAQKASDLDSYTCYLLKCFYPESVDSDFVCFNPEDFNKY